MEGPIERSGVLAWNTSDGIGRLTLSNPPKNCLVEPEAADAEVLARWLSEPSLRGVIIAGEGRHFSAGADTERLRKLASEPASLFSGMEAGKKVLGIIRACEVPVIAAVRGACLGGGLEIALACHIRVASESAFFAFPESGLSVLPGLGGTVFLPRLVSPGRALELLLSGDMIGSSRALELGIVDHRVPAAELDSFCVSLLDSMTAGKPSRVVRAIVRSVHNALALPLDEALTEETRLFCGLAAALGEDDSDA